MGSDRRFTLVLIGWMVALAVALLAAVEALRTPGLGAVRLLAGIGVTFAVAGMWRHVSRTNAVLVRFIETLRHQDFAARFDKRGGAGFDQLGQAMDGVVRALQRQSDVASRENRFLEALVDDAPVALLIIDDAQGVRLANKAARQMFGRHEGSRPADFAVYGEAFAQRLGQPGADGRELLLLRLGQAPQRAIIRTARLDRLGLAVHAMTIEPVQATLDGVEMAAQTDLVRVLTHEILNSLTPVASLSGTAATLLDKDPPDLTAARIAITTLTRRAESLHRFIQRYREIARALEPRHQIFAADPFASELARLFAAEWPDHRLTLNIEDGLMIEADPDLLAQALINLLRNAAQATHDHAAAPAITLGMKRERGQFLIQIEDNGPGVPEQLKSDIFLPFFTTRRDGSGIGLNLVRQIVIASGWSIEVENGDQGGARFTISGG